MVLPRASRRAMFAARPGACHPPRWAGFAGGVVWWQVMKTTALKSAKRFGMAAVAWLAWLLWSVSPTSAETGQGTVWLVDLKGPLSPASADLLIRAIEGAEDAQAQALVIRMDTPGGLDKAMRDLVQRILAAEVPVVTFVAPGRCPCGQRGHLHCLREPRRRHGARDEHRFVRPRSASAVRRCRRDLRRAARRRTMPPHPLTR